MTQKPSLLFLAPLMPAPTGNGLAMRAGLILEALARNFSVHLLVVPLFGAERISRFAKERAARTMVAHLDPRDDALRLAASDPKRAMALLMAQPQPVLCRFATRALLGRLAAHFAGVRFDVIHVMRLYMAPYAAPFLEAGARPPAAVLDLDDDEVRTRARLGSLYAQGDDQDDVVLIPLAAAKSRVIGSEQASRRTVDFILVKARAPKLMEPTQQAVRTLLRQRHRLREAAPDDFTVENLEALLATTGQIARALGLLLGSVASISLVVGGISIMNVMLVSVTERTREIGLRLALGARPCDIRNQFLVESVVLGGLGGIAGILLGVAVSIAIAQLAGWPALVSLGAIAIAFGFAAAVGLIFGLFPALRAARLQPIEALRAE
jgi:ABC-type antimicrobial peptide transport system permease subunit